MTRHIARDPRTRADLPDATIEAMRDAMQTARLAAEKASRIAEAVMNNEMLTLPARHRQGAGVLPRLCALAARRAKPPARRALPLVFQ